MTEAELEWSWPYGVEQQFDPNPEKFFELTSVDQTGMSGPGVIPMRKLTNLNGLRLPVLRVEEDAPSGRPDLSRLSKIIIRPEAIVYAYAEQGLRDEAGWWDGYARCALRIENGKLVHGELSIPITAGRFMDSPAPAQPD